MKKIISFFILTFSLFLLNACFKANDNVGHGGRCTGSASCSACSNCSGCMHCSSGGSCGVCSGGRSGRNSSSDGSIKNRISKKSKSSKPSKIIIDEVNVNINSSNRYMAAGIAVTNIYEKPSSQSKVIATVPKNTQLTQLAKTGLWYKVQIKSSGKKGYVYHKDIK